MSRPTTTPPVICVLDGPRTCSQLFNKLFAAHGQLQPIFHPYMGCSMYGPERMTARLGGSHTSLQAKNDLAATHYLPEETYEAASNRLRSSIDGSHATGKIPWVKDHLICLMQVALMLNATTHRPQEVVEPISNPTMVPDDLLWNMTPIILIRHPALRVPAYYRAQRPVFKERADEEILVAMTSTRWAQIVFDAYNSRPEAASSIVVDAEDIVHHTRSLAERVCALLNIDASGVQYKWEVVPHEMWPSDPIMQGFFKTLLKSDGVQREGQPAERHLNIDSETKCWEHEFGADTAQQLRKVVENDLPIYERLHQYRVRV